MAYVGGLRSERDVARELAYFEGYQAALAAASTQALTGAAAWHWHDDMVRCVDDCVGIFREKAAAAGLAAAVPRSWPNASACGAP